MVSAVAVACAQPSPGTAPAAQPTVPGAPAAGATVAPTTGAAPASASGTLRVVEVSLGTQSMDAIVTTEAPPQAYLIYEPLLRYDDKGNLIPWLARSWSTSTDG
jgi:peptide/nickel transport system substrate-binding protein